MTAPANSVSVTAGSATVTGYLTQFVAAKDDLFLLGGVGVAIQNRDTSSQITLQEPWPGPTVAGQDVWTILATGPYWSSALTLNKQVADLLAKVDGGLPLKPDVAGPLAGRDGYNNQAAGFIFLATDGDTWVLYAKLTDANSPDAWSPGQAVKPSPAATTFESEAARDAAESAAAAAAEHASATQADAVTTTNAASAAALAAAEATSLVTLLGVLNFDFGTLTASPATSPLDLGTL